MFHIRLADLCIRIENQYPFVEHQCKNFLCDDENAVFTVSVTDEEIAAEQALGDFPPAYCESICIYRHICEQIAPYNVFLLHSSVIEVDGHAYAFTAKSGVGKSTHTSLWLKNIPHARVLNGDKPLYRLESDGSLTVFGTPWNGKENWGENISAPLAAICFIERSHENAIRRADESEVVSRLMHQLYLRGSRQNINRQLVLMDALVRAVPYYVLSCTISDEAAHLAWSTMKQSK
jgi:hypothetical protein